MLQKLHEKIKGWIASVIIGLICLTFVLWGIEYYVSGSQAKGAEVVKVDGVAITEHEVKQLVRQMQQEEMAQGVALTDQINQELRSLAVQNLMAEVALSHAAKKMGFAVQPQQLQEIVAQLPLFQENDQFSPERFQQFLYHRGMNQSQFLEKLSQEVLLNQVKIGIEESAFLLPNLFDAYLNLFFQTRSFHYVVIPARLFSAKVSVSMNEEKAYYRNNKELWRVPEKVSIEYIELSPTDLRKTIHFSDGELQAYYKEHIGNYKQAARWRVEKITVPVPNHASVQQINDARQQMQAWLTQMKKGTSFDALYKAHQGETITLDENTAVPEVIDQLKKMKKDHVSLPFNTTEGFNIVRLLAFMPATTSSFLAVKNDIRALLTHQRIQQMLSQLSETLANLTLINPGSLQPAAKALKLDVKTSSFFDAKGDKEGIAASPEVVQTAFSKDVLQQKDNSNPITLKNGSIVVLRIKQYLPSQISDFVNVQAKIHQSLLEQKAQAKAAMLATDFLEVSQQKEKSLESILKKNQLNWKQEKNISRNDQKIPAPILSAAFRLSLGQNNRATTASLPNGDSVFIQLMAIQQPNLQKINKAQQQDFQRQLREMFGKMRYQLYMMHVREQAKTKFPSF